LDKFLEMGTKPLRPFADLRLGTAKTKKRRKQKWKTVI
jgi:hypothetical protein